MDVELLVCLLICFYFMFSMERDGINPEHLRKNDL
jgi:hypothetical protein